MITVTRRVNAAETACRCSQFIGKTSRSGSVGGADCEDSCAQFIHRTKLPKRAELIYDIN